MNNTMTFNGIDGTEYDLSLNFLIVKAVSGADFSAVEKDAPNIMSLDGKVAELYNDMPMIAAFAFAIVWYKKAFTEKFDTSKENYAKEEERFLANISGSVFLELREAFWNALSDFFPQLASDLSRIRIVNEAGMEEVAKNNERLQENGIKAMKRTINQVVNLAIDSLSGGQSGPNAES